MNIDRLTDSELADMAANIVALLGGASLEAIDPAVRTALIAAFGTLPADLATQTAEASNRVGEKLAAFSTKDSTRLQVLELTRQTRDALKAGRASKSEYDLCGFGFPAEPVKMYEAQDPSDLAVVGFSNGVNQGRFRGNNLPGRVVYEIWRRHGDEGPWGKHTLTKKQSFTDTGVTPGQYYEYRVRAIAAQTTSNFSNSAVVYGML
ncbi:MAG: hypothetical protein WBO10_01405 [Pyrinomonadaceae bacterium]